MTAALDLPLDLVALEFEIPCEWEDSPCDKSAVVMNKGCSDEHAYGLCLEHFEALRRWFYDHVDCTCATCHRPFMHFHTHYNTVPL